MYHIEDNGQPLVSLGLIIGLDYKNPHTNLYQVSPFHEMNEDLVNDRLFGYYCDLKFFFLNFLILKFTPSFFLKICF